MDGFRISGATPAQENRSNTDIDFEVVSYNIRGLANDRKIGKKVMNYMKKHSSGNSVICMQEMCLLKNLRKYFEPSGEGI